jgi:hypothetical protein
VCLRSACTPEAPYAVDLVFDGLLHPWEFRIDVTVTRTSTGIVLFQDGFWLPTDDGHAEVPNIVPLPYSAQTYDIDVDFFPDKDHNFQIDDTGVPTNGISNGGGFFQVTQPCTSAGGT